MGWTAGSDAGKACRKRYYERNREIIRAKQHAYYTKMRLEILANKAEEYAKNPEKKRADARNKRGRRLTSLLLSGARERSRRLGFPCTITKQDIVIPEFCPILGMKLEIGIGAPSGNSPTLDKIDPTLGYVPGNVQVISMKANTMKSNANRHELIAFAKWVNNRFSN